MPALQAWIALLRAHARMTRDLSASLSAEHGLTLNDYDVLAQLANAPDRMLKRVELANSVLLTASGITRLLDGLERAGWVERGACPTDARVSYAVLTDAGLKKLREASKTHLREVEATLEEHLSTKELETLRDLLGRLPGIGPDDAACGVEEE